jgi:hypothetical protein
MPNIGDIGGKIYRLCFINRQDGYFIMRECRRINNDIFGAVLTSSVNLVDQTNL